MCSVEAGHISMNLKDKKQKTYAMAIYACIVGVVSFQLWQSGFWANAYRNDH